MLFELIFKKQSNAAPKGRGSFSGAYPACPALGRELRSTFTGLFTLWQGNIFGFFVFSGFGAWGKPAITLCGLARALVRPWRNIFLDGAEEFLNKEFALAYPLPLTIL